MADQQGGLHPDVLRVVTRVCQEEVFRQAVQMNPDAALRDYTLDDSERQALMSLLNNWDRLPEAIAEQGIGFSGLRSRTVRSMLSSQPD